MCKLCRITALAATARWPKPLEPSIADLNFLVTCAHDLQEAWQKSKTHHSQDKSTESNNGTPVAPNDSGANVPPPPAPLLETLRTLSTALTSLERERMAWWSGKAALVRQLTLDAGEGTQGQVRLTELHKINNSARERIEAMEARLRGFLRWGIGVEGGLVGG